MSNDRPDWETELSDGLERRVRGLHEAPLTLEHVKGKAMNIRRKRRAAVAGGILAAAAVIVPVAVIAGNDAGDGSRDIPAATRSATTTPTPSDTVPAGAGELGVAYLEGAEYHTATVTSGGSSSGSGVNLPRDDYRDVAQLGDDLYAYRNDDDTGEATIDVVSPAGEVTDTIRVAGPFVVTESGETIAYLTRDGELMTRSALGELSLGSDFGATAFPAAVVGGPDCHDAEAGGDGCRVFLDFGDGETTPTAVDSHGINEPPFADAIRVQDADGAGLISVQTSYSDTGSCGGVYDETEGKLAFRTCDFFVQGLSPDGDHVTATDPYGDDIGYGFVAVLDAKTGAEVARYSPEGGFIAQVVWEDDEHTLLTVFGNGHWQIVRLATDGSIEDVVGPSTSGDEAAPAYVLTGGR